MDHHADLSPPIFWPPHPEDNARRRILGLLLICAALLCIGAAPAQVVRLANHSAAPFAGWKRTTVDRLPPARAGEWPDGTRYVVGRRLGLDAWVVDVHVALQAGTRMSRDLSTAAPMDFALAPLPADPTAHFGGIATIGGQPAQIIGLQPDGAAWLVTLRSRVGRMLCVHAWLCWYPGQAWATGEALVVASNPSVPDMGEAVPPGLDLRIGDGLVVWPGRGIGPIVSAGTWLADGQGRALPFVAVWLRHLTRASDWSSVGASIDLGIGAVGVSGLLADGAPLMPEGASGRAWAAGLWPEAVRRLHTWDPPVCGPPGISGSAGEQEDSLFHAGGEALLPDGVGAEWVRYLSALKLYSERPCNHLEADGTWLDPDRHPSLLFWDGRVHWHTGVSPDRLGKPRVLTADEAHGRYGPDVQHTYVRTLVAAARLTGSPACQQLLRNLATVYLLQRTANPSWSTSQWESAREWGCEGQFVQDCHRELEDRAMAARVVARWRERVERVLLPRMAGKDLLVVWDRDQRVNPDGLGAQWWQESFASWSIDRTCQLVGPAEGRALALRIARRVLDVAWREVELSGLDEAIVRFADPELQAIHEAAVPVVGAEDAAGSWWRAQPQGPIDGSANAQNPASDSFNHYGMPLCVAVVLRHDPTNAKALAVWAQLMAAGGDKARRWMPPGVPQ